MADATDYCAIFPSATADIRLLGFRRTQPVKEAGEVLSVSGSSSVCQLPLDAYLCPAIVEPLQQTGDDSLPSCHLISSELLNIPLPPLQCPR